MFMNFFSNNLKYLVADTKKSLRQIAKESGVSAMQYSRYLNSSIPRLDVIYYIAKNLNGSMDDLIGRY